MEKLKFLKLLTSAVLVSVIFAAPYQSDEFLLGGWSIPDGMGGNTTVISASGLTVNSNPALLSEISRMQISVSGGNFWSGLVNLAQIGVAKSNGKWSYGLSANILGGDDIKITELQNPTQPMSVQNYPQVVDEQGHYTASINLGLSRNFEKFSAGISSKIVKKKIPDHSGFGFSASCGALWKPMDNLKVGIYARDISTYQLFWDDDVHETGLPSFSVGLSYRVDISSNWAITIAPEGNYGIDEGLGLFKAGIAADYSDILTFALGTRDGSITAGAQLKVKKFRVGASTNYHLSLGQSYNFSVGYEINK